MKNIIYSTRNIFYSLIGLLLVNLNYVVHSQDTETPTLEWWVVDNGTAADSTIQTIIVYIIRFLYLVAVLYILRWGYLIITAWWNNSQTSKWKSLIISALIGIVVVWLASLVIDWLMWIT